MKALGKIEVTIFLEARGKCVSFESNKHYTVIRHRHISA